VPASCRSGLCPKIAALTFADHAVAVVVVESECRAAQRRSDHDGQTVDGDPGRQHPLARRNHRRPHAVRAVPREVDHPAHDLEAVVVEEQLGEIEGRADRRDIALPLHPVLFLIHRARDIDEQHELDIDRQGEFLRAGRRAAGIQAEREAECGDEAQHGLSPNERSNTPLEGHCRRRAGPRPAGGQGWMRGDHAFVLRQRALSGGSVRPSSGPTLDVR